MKDTWIIRLTPEAAHTNQQLPILSSELVGDASVDVTLEWSGRVDTKDGALVFYSWDKQLQAVYAAGSWIWLKRQDPPMTSRSMADPPTPRGRVKVRRDADGVLRQTGVRKLPERVG